MDWEERQARLCFLTQRGTAATGHPVVAEFGEPGAPLRAGVLWAAGFDPLQGEDWKLMGLAACGTKDGKLYQIIRPMLRVHRGGFSKISGL